MNDFNQEHKHWMMHEYSLFGIDNYVLCKIFKEVRILKKSLSVLLKQQERKVLVLEKDEHIMNVVSED